MELICNDLGVGEEVFDEGLVGITHVDRDSVYVLSSGDLRKSFLEVRTTFPIHNFHESFVGVINDHGDKILSSIAFFSFKRVLIDAYAFGPGVLFCAASEF